MRSCLQIIAILVTLLGGIVSPLVAATELQVPPVHKRILPNGLTILVREDHSAPVVSAQTWVSAGSITEGDQLGAGLSHVLEHMLFKGTTSRGVAEIAQQIDAHGGYMNAYTTFERTVYYIDMPAAYWQTAVEILADCMMNATIPEEELLKEKNVILREMAMNVDDPGRRASRVLWSTAYQIHPYRHPVIGYPDIYNNLTRDDVVAYYQKFYRPNNMIFSVVGDIDASAVIDKIDKLTVDWKRGAIAPPYIAAEPRQLTPRRRDESMSVELSRISLAWHIPALTDPDVYALDALAILLGEGRSSRLYRILQQERGLVHSIGCSSYTPAHPGLFIISASADRENRELTISAIQEQVEQVRRNGVSPDEVTKAIRIATSHYLAGLKTMKGQASDIAMNELSMGDPQFSRQYLERLGRVTATDVQRVATQYLAAQGLTITTLNPLEEQAQAAAAEQPTTDIVIEKFVLPNGLRLLVREDPRLPVVDLHAIFRGGVLAENRENNGITKLAARMLLKGTPMRSAEQIAEEIESLGGSISHFSGNNSFGISAEVLSNDLTMALDIITDVIRNPIFPQDRFEREQDTQVAEIKAEQEQILRAAQQLLRESLYETHPYRLNSLGQTTTVEALTRADVDAFYRSHLAPDQMVLCVFGNVDAGEVHQAVQQRFGDLSPPTQPHSTNLKPERLATSLRRVESRPREQAVLLLGFSGTQIDDQDRYPLELIDAAYSGQGSRLYMRIREELGLAYYVGAYQLVGLSPGYLAFYLGTTPDKVATCEAELRKELERLAAEGLSTEELERAKSSLIGNQLIRRQDNGDLALAAGLDELYGLGYDFSLSAPDRYRAVTEEEIRRVATRYFGQAPSAMVIVTPLEMESSATTE